MGDIPKQGDLHTSSEEKPTCFEKRLASGAPCLYPPGFLAPTYPCLPGTPATWLPGFNLASGYLAASFLLLLATCLAAARHLARSTPGVKNKLPHGSMPQRKTCEGARALGDIPKQGDLHRSGEGKQPFLKKTGLRGTLALATWLPGPQLPLASWPPAT